MKSQDVSSEMYHGELGSEEEGECCPIGEVGGGRTNSAKEEKNQGPEAGPGHTTQARTDERDADPKSGMADSLAGMLRLRAVRKVTREAQNGGPGGEGGKVHRWVLNTESEHPAARENRG